MAEAVATSSDRRAEQMPIWPSAARIIATFAIFTFHYLGLLGRYQYRLSVWALLTFSFLSGYLAHARGTSRRSWAIKRYFSVMIPHWIVITPVLVANWATHYKPVTAVEALITFLGGNLFLTNPLYVITWYVTFVLLLYGYLFVDSYFRGWLRLLVSAAGFAFFGWLGYNEYFFPFSIGLCVAAWFPPRAKVARSAIATSIGRVSFRLQELCYPFFLAHGAVLLVMLRVTPFNPPVLFVAAFAVSVVAAFVIHIMSQPLLGLALATVGRNRPSA
ncbi:MAG: hypothetical protein ABL961_04865 [Vicinamibacterales bacterium]